MSIAKHGRAAVTLGMLAIAAACTESSPSDPGTSAQPWTEQFIFGNSSINTAAIVTNQDGISAHILTDYVTQAALPDTDLELFITHVYIPAASGTDSRLIDVSVTAGRTDGSRTENFFRQAELVQRGTVGGQLYDIYRLEGLFLGSPVLRPSNFANVVFTFRVEYLRAGSVVHSTHKTVEIYKR